MQPLLAAGLKLRAPFAPRCCCRPTLRPILAAALPAPASFTQIYLAPQGLQGTKVPQNYCKAPRQVLPPRRAVPPHCQRVCPRSNRQTMLYCCQNSVCNSLTNVHPQCHVPLAQGCKQTEVPEPCSSPSAPPGRVWAASRPSPAHARPSCLPGAAAGARPLGHGLWQATHRLWGCIGAADGAVGLAWAGRAHKPWHAPGPLLGSPPPLTPPLWKPSLA